MFVSNLLNPRRRGGVGTEGEYKILGFAFFIHIIYFYHQKNGDIAYCHPSAMRNVPRYASR